MVMISLTGSMLVGRTANECSALKSRVEQLLEAGLEASFLSCDDLQSEEPALMLGSEGGAAFVPDDYQIDARRTVAFIEKVTLKIHFLSSSNGCFVSCAFKILSFIYIIINLFLYCLIG